jgi:YggT family protein
MIFSWVRVEPGTPWASIEAGLVRLTEPVLGPLRRVIPPMRMGAAYFDASPIIVLVLILVIC